MKTNNINGEIINLASGDPISYAEFVIEKVKTYIGKGDLKIKGYEINMKPYVLIKIQPLIME